MHDSDAGMDELGYVADLQANVIANLRKLLTDERTQHPFTIIHFHYLEIAKLLLTQYVYRHN